MGAAASLYVFAVALADRFENVRLLGLAGLGLYLPGAVWLLWRAVQPGLPLWPHLAVIWSPVVPLLLALSAVLWLPEDVGTYLGLMLYGLYALALVFMSLFATFLRVTRSLDPEF
jgi:hypothetical protein